MKTPKRKVIKLESLPGKEVPVSVSELEYLLLIDAIVLNCDSFDSGEAEESYPYGYAGLAENNAATEYLTGPVSLKLVRFCLDQAIQSYREDGQEGREEIANDLLTKIIRETSNDLDFKVDQFMRSVLDNNLSDVLEAMARFQEDYCSVLRKEADVLRSAAKEVR